MKNKLRWNKNDFLKQASKHPFDCGMSAMCGVPWEGEEERTQITPYLEAQSKTVTTSTNICWLKKRCIFSLSKYHFNHCAVAPSFTGIKPFVCLHYILREYLKSQVALATFSSRFSDATCNRWTDASHLRRKAQFPMTSL